MKVDTTITGLDDVTRLLKVVGPRAANNIMRATAHDVAKEIRDEAKREMPEDEGVMKAATKHKRERAMPGYAESTVRVGRDAFYWRFLEYGDGPDRIAHDMFLKALNRMRARLVPKFLTVFGAKFEQAAARATKRADKMRIRGR